MRSHENFRMVPERMSWRERLDAEDVQGGGLELAGVERFDQIRIDDMRSTSHVDETSTVFEMREQVPRE